MVQTYKYITSLIVRFIELQIIPLRYLESRLFISIAKVQIILELFSGGENSIYLIANRQNNKNNKSREDYFNQQKIDILYILRVYSRDVNNYRNKVSRNYKFIRIVRFILTIFLYRFIKQNIIYKIYFYLLFNYSSSNSIYQLYIFIYSSRDLVYSYF